MRSEGPRLRIACALQEAPNIINMPVVKQHFAGRSQAPSRTTSVRCTAPLGGSPHVAIVRRQFEHAEDLGLGTSNLSQFEIIELKM